MGKLKSALKTKFLAVSFFCLENFQNVLKCFVFRNECPLSIELETKSTVIKKNS